MKNLLRLFKRVGKTDRETGEHNAENSAGDHWGRQARTVESQSQPVAWTSSPLVKSMYINPTISGDSDTNWFAYVAKKYFPEPVERALSLGCGGGGLERHGIALNVAAHFDACDASEGAIKLAREMAVDAGIDARVNYQVADLNTAILPQACYDVVFASHSLHHIHDLGHLLGQARAALRNSGWFVTNEYVGPNQFQWTDPQIAYSQELLDSLPENLRRDIRTGNLKTKIERPTIEFMNGFDPTEAIRSEEIRPLVARHFDTVEQIEFGGTLLQLVLDGIAANFSDTPEHRQHLQSLIDREQQLMAEGEIGSDFTLIVARARASGA